MMVVLVCRSRQTQEEALKLRRIQKELQALDDMVSSDISILRDRIEQASWDYSAARYDHEQTFRNTSTDSGTSVGNTAPCSMSSVSDSGSSSDSSHVFRVYFLQLVISRDNQTIIR